MEEREHDVPDWLAELTAKIGQHLERLTVTTPSIELAMQAEKESLEGRCQGWLQSLANATLPQSIRAHIESSWSMAHGRISEIEAALAEQAHRQSRVENIVQPADVCDRLNRLADILAENNPTLGNLELSLHIDRIDCFPDGTVRMRSCKLGTMPDAIDLLMAAGEDSKGPDSVDQVLRTRRRTRLRVEPFEDGGRELRETAEFAADTDRFAGLNEEWFWVDEFTVPESSSWAADHAEAIFRRRKAANLSFAKLAKEFGRTPQTMRAAVQLYLAAHPDETDIKLRCGGKRGPKIDVSKFADEARQLWIDGESKVALAKRYKCSPPTIDKAIAFAYERDGLAMPTRADARRAKAAEARRLLDAGKSLHEIAAEMEVSGTSARTYLRDSYAAEGKPMPDLRRRPRRAPDAV